MSEEPVAPVSEAPAEAPVSEQPNQAEATEGQTEAQAEAERLFKLKYGDSDREVTLEELQSLAQKSFGANQKFEEAAAMRRETEQIFKEIRENPYEAIDKLGLKEVLAKKPQMLRDILGSEGYQDFVEREAWEYIQEAQKSPEQREIEELRRYRDEREAQERLAKEEAEMTAKQREEAALVEQYQKEFHTKIIDALEVGKLPKNQETVARMSKMMMSAIENGYEIDPKELVTEVRKSYDEEHKLLYSQMDPEELYNYLGPDKVKSLRELELNKRGNPRGSASGLQTKTEVRSPGGRPKDQISEEEYFQRIRDSLGMS